MLEVGTTFYERSTTFVVLKFVFSESQYNAIRAKLEKEQKWCREKLNPNKNYISDYTQGRISGLEMAIQIVSRFIEREDV